MNNELNVSMYKRNARPNNKKLINYYLPVCYLLRIQQQLVNTTYNKRAEIEDYKFLLNLISDKVIFPPYCCLNTDPCSTVS